jgi:hypothetical protein
MNNADYLCRKVTDIYKEMMLEIPNSILHCQEPMISLMEISHQNMTSDVLHINKFADDLHTKSSIIDEQTQQNCEESDRFRTQAQTTELAS